MTTTATRTSKKVCFITTRYLVKATGTICCKIATQSDMDYTTCVHADGRTSCTDQNGNECQGHMYTGICYHVKHVQAMEAFRTASQIAPAVVVSEIHPAPSIYLTDEELNENPFVDQAPVSEAVQLVRNSSAALLARIEAETMAQIASELADVSTNGHVDSEQKRIEFIDSIDLGSKGALTKNAGFSLLRK